jgi:imidazolonepropionase-like amidohydrolase
MLARPAHTGLTSIVLTCLIWILSPCLASAHDQTPGSPQKKPIAIVGGTIHPIDGPEITDGIVLLVEGKIAAVGKSEQVEVPADATRIDAMGSHVYPGLVAAMSDIGLREIDAVAATVDTSEVGDTNPNVRSWVAVNPDSELFPVSRANGILTAMVAPLGQRWRGQSAVMSLDGWSASEMTIKAPAGLCLAWESIESTKQEDKDRIENRERAMKELDELIDQAKRYEAGKVDGKDLVLESLLPVLRGELPVYTEANSAAAIESAVAYAVANRLKIIIYGGHDAAQCATLLREHNVPVILPGTLREPLHPHDAYDLPYTLPVRLKQAGVTFCISGEGSGYPGGATNLRNLPYQAARAVAYGLPYQDALRSITLGAAEIIGVGDRLGSLTVGKDATVMIVDGDILETKSNVTHAWIQGRDVDLGNRHRTLYEKYQRLISGE